MGALDALWSWHLLAALPVALLLSWGRWRRTVRSADAAPPLAGRGHGAGLLGRVTGGGFAPGSGRGGGL